MRYSKASRQISRATTLKHNFRNGGWKNWLRRYLRIIAPSILQANAGPRISYPEAHGGHDDHSKCPLHDWRKRVIGTCGHDPDAALIGKPFTFPAGAGKPGPLPAVDAG